MKKYYYEVTFWDKRVMRREGVSKRIAEAVYITFCEEMARMNVREVGWGPMP